MNNNHPEIEHEHCTVCRHCGTAVRMVKYGDFDPLVPLDDDGGLHSISCDEKRQKKEHDEARRRSV